MKTILIVDGICPRGLAMIRFLSSSGEYHILVFTKTTTCPGARAANALPSVTLLLNRASTGYDLQTFVAAAQRCPSVLICSSAANSEGKDGVQWGARLVQSAASAGVKHLVFLTMERERKQYSTDNFMHSQSKSPTVWTIIRSPTNDSSSSQSSSVNNDERSLTPTQFRNLAYYVNWVFANPDRSTGLDFVLPAGEPSGVGTSERRNSRVESAGSASTARPAPSRTGSGRYMDSGRANAIQQWVAKTNPDRKEQSDGSEDEEEDSSDGESGSESD